MIDLFKFSNNDKLIVTIVKAVFLIYFLNFILSFLFNLLVPDIYVDLIQESKSEVIDNFLIITAVIIAPFVETIVFQFLLFKILGKVIKNRFVLIIVASLVFSLAHGLNPLKLILHFTSGMVFNSLYYSLKSSISNSCITVIIVHAIVNLISITLSLIVNYSV